MGGMAAQIPLKDDPAANEAALAKVRADKLREVLDGHDGTWVAHPGLVPVARAVFDEHMPAPNQIDWQRDDVTVTARDLLRPVEGTRTEAGLRHNIRVSVQYLEAWLRGQGCVPLYHLMEDAATAEISRAQVWQWIRHGVALDDGRPLTKDRFRALLVEEMDRIRLEVGEARFRTGRFEEARVLFERLTTAPEFCEFLTLPAYELLESTTGEIPAMSAAVTPLPRRAVLRPVPPRSAPLGGRAAPLRPRGGREAARLGPGRAHPGPPGRRAALGAPARPRPTSTRSAPSPATRRCSRSRPA